MATRRFTERQASGALRTVAVPPAAAATFSDTTTSIPAASDFQLNVTVDVDKAAGMVQLANPGTLANAATVLCTTTAADAHSQTIGVTSQAYSGATQLSADGMFGTNVRLKSAVYNVSLGRFELTFRNVDAVLSQTLSVSGLAVAF